MSEIVQSVAAGTLMLPLVNGRFWWPITPDGQAGSFTPLQVLPETDAFASMLMRRW